jgi:YNFM family putative membrane transporter
VLGSAGGWFWEYGRWPALVAFSMALLLGALALALALRRLATSAGPR